MLLEQTTSCRGPTTVGQVIIETPANGDNAKNTSHRRKRDTQTSNRSLDQDSRKLAGPNIEDNDVLFLWFLIVVLIWMAQSILSITQFLIGLLLHDEFAWCRIHSFAWMSIDASISFCLELSSLY